MTLNPNIFIYQSSRSSVCKVAQSTVYSFPETETEWAVSEIVLKRPSCFYPILINELLRYLLFVSWKCHPESQELFTHTWMSFHSCPGETPLPCCEISFYHKLPDIVAHLSVQQSLTTSLLKQYHLFPSIAAEHWRGQEEVSLAPSPTKASHHQKWRRVTCTLAVHDWNSQVQLWQWDFFTGQKLTDNLSQPNWMLYIPWYPSCWLHDRVLQSIQKKMCKFVICQVNKAESPQQKFPRQDWANTRTSIVARRKDKQDLLLLTPGAIRNSSTILNKSHHSLLLACCL